MALVQDRLICDVEMLVDVRPVGAPGTVVVEPVPDAFTSIAVSSHWSPLLAVQLQVTELGDGIIFELDAPVTALGILTSHCCVHVGEESFTPPYIDGRSSTKSFAYLVVIDIAGLLAAVLWFVVLVGIGVV